MRLNELLPENIIRDEKLIIVKNTIDKLSCTINNVRELTKELYTNFIEDDSLTQILTDLIEFSEAFNGLDAEEFESAVREMKPCTPRGHTAASAPPADGRWA